jgi:hypothetical protein
MDYAKLMFEKRENFNELNSGTDQMSSNFKELIFRCIKEG